MFRLYALAFDVILGTDSELTLSQTLILDWSKLKESADNNFEFDNKSGKLSQDTPVLPQVVKLGHAPNKIQV